MVQTRRAFRQTLEQVRSDPRMQNAIGSPVGYEPETEIEHFYLCKACGQAVDKRDLGAVLHHEDPGHEPLAAEDAERLSRITEQLRAALGTP